MARRSLTSILLKAEITETRTLLNLQDLTIAFEDEGRRPLGRCGTDSEHRTIPHMRDWIDDTGEPGDKYDPELAALLEEASAGVELDPVS